MFLLLNLVREMRLFASEKHIFQVPKLPRCRSLGKVLSTYSAHSRVR